MAKIQIKSEKLTPFGGIFGSTDMFRGLEYPYTDNTQLGGAKDLDPRIYSAAKNCLNVSKTHSSG